jgi:hypothetical protein
MTERTALFISHATPEDNVFTLWLGAKLSAAGYEVWADVLKLVAGQDWERKLEDALRNRALKVLLVGTQTGLNKDGVRKEINIATTKSKELNDKEFIIPLKLEPYEPNFNTVLAQHIDFSKSWAAGLKELLEVLETYKVPKAPTENATLWRAVQLVHGKEPVQIEENLISNWLKFKSLPVEVHHYDFNTGISYAAKKRLLNNFPIPLVTKEGAGFISFADYPSLQERMPEYPIKLIDSIKTEDFIETGWPSQGIERRDARKHFSDMMRQGLNVVFAAKQLSYYEMSNKKLCWFGEKDVVPENKIRFVWPNSITGLRVIRGFSKKRNMYWHYGFSPQVAMWPEPHIKLRGNLVFSEDGKTAIDDVKKMHRLRRSFTKSWRNARWRDMLMSMLWWITDGADTLVIPFGEEKGAVLEIPTITFTSPVSMPAEIEEPDPEDEDDPDEEEGPFACDDLDSIAEEVEA